MIKNKSYIPDDVPRFSRQWWLGMLRNFLAVALVTILVWVYADMEFTDTFEVRATLHLTVSKEDRTLLAGADLRKDIPITFSVVGNRSALSDFQQWLKAQGSSLTFDAGDRFEPSPRIQTVQTQTILAENQALNLQARGLSVASVEPAAISFKLDKIISVPNIPVEFQSTGATLAGPPVIRPASVTIRVAQTVWDDITSALPRSDDRKLRTRPVDLKTVTADQPITAEIVPSISIGPDKSIPVEPMVESVQVDVRVAAVTGEKPFKVPVFLLQPGAWAEDNTWNEYKLVRKGGESWVKDISVQGPKTELDSLTSEDITAYVVLRDDDKKPTETFPARDVIVRFPPGKPHLEVVGGAPKISFRLEKRTTPTGP